MKHLGDITKIDGGKIPVVDIITGGSPCQDLSVAGLRKGIQHGELGDEETTRSGLFMDQLRIVKEMRANDIRNGRSGVDVRPRYMVWENVPGAFSVNQGKDFQAVLTEIVRVIEPTAPDVPMPEKGWPYAGCIYDELGGWSIAYRVHDAQFWGVPQRRRRIALVADFNGLSAAEILFDPQLRGEAEASESDQTVRDSGKQRGRKVQPLGESLPRNFEPSGEAWEGTAKSSAGRSDGTGCSVDTYSVPAMNSEGMLSNNPQAGFHISDVARTVDPSGLNPACYQGGAAVVGCAVDCRNGTETPFCERDSAIEERGTQPQHEHGCESPGAECFQNTGHGWWSESNVATSVRTPAGGVERKQTLLPQGADLYNGTLTGGVAASLTAASGAPNTSGPKVLWGGSNRGNPLKQDRSDTQRNRLLPSAPMKTTPCAGVIGLDHVLLSGGTTFQGRGWYDEVSGCLKTLPHGVMTDETERGSGS